MQASEIITRVRRQLVESSAAFWSDIELLDLINEAESDYNNKTRLLESKAFLSTVQGRLSYPVPSNWLSARALFYNEPESDGDPVWRRLFPTNLEKQAQERPNFQSTVSDNQDTPRRYFIWNKEIYLVPAPDTNGSSNVCMFFKSKPVKLQVATEELNFDDGLSYALEAYVLWKAWSKEKEQNLALEQKTLYDQYVREGRRWAKLQSGDQKYKLDIESPLSFTTGSRFITGFNPF